MGIPPCAGPEIPMFQHVEMAAAPGTGLPSNLNTPVGMTDERQYYSSRTTVPSRSLTSARAALQQLALKSRHDCSYIPLNEDDSQSSIDIPAQPPPARTVGQPHIQSRRTFSSHCAGFEVTCVQKNTLPAISFGVDAPMPRWRIEHIHPILARRNGAPRWVFDAGTDFTRYGWTEDMIYEYAYKWLEDTLGNPSFKEYVRSNILDGHGKDPLPTLPPAPNTCYFQSWAELPGTHNDMWYTGPDYQPSRMARSTADASQVPPQPDLTDSERSGKSFHPTEGCNSIDLELGQQRQTRILRKRSTDEEQPMPLDGYRWVWFIVAFLVSSMFLCLFLYAFEIIK